MKINNLYIYVNHIKKLYSLQDLVNGLLHFDLEAIS